MGKLKKVKLNKTRHGVESCGFSFEVTFLCSVINEPTTLTVTVRYHSGGSMKLNACILLLAHMVYL
jgi:hypothetical protein